MQLSPTFVTHNAAGSKLTLLVARCVAILLHGLS